MFHHPKKHTEKVALLARLPLFQGLGPRELELVERHADRVSAKPGTVLARPGGVARELILVLSGTIRVEAGGQTVGRLTSGDLYGELSLLSHRPRTASVIAETGVSLIVIEGRAFAALLQDLPLLQHRLLSALSRRLWAAEAKPLLAKVS